MLLLLRQSLHNGICGEMKITTTTEENGFPTQARKRPTYKRTGTSAKFG